MIGATPGDDVLHGTEDADYLDADGGSDQVYGLGGGDILVGGSSGDYIDGGAGFDMASYAGSSAGVSISLRSGSVHGGDAEGDVLASIELLQGSTFADTLDGDDGYNWLDGLESNDALAGWNGDDVLLGGDGNDVLRGGAGADRLEGGAGADLASYYTGLAGVLVNLVSGNGSGGDAAGDILIGIENVSGSQGNDSLVGNTFANVLQGWGGNDVLTGAGGKDILTGGAGGDRFVYGSAAQSLVGADADVITDFSHVQGDRVDLSVIDASTAAAGNQVFSFIGTGLFTGIAGQLRYAVSGGVTTIAGDLNGDRASDFHIQLTGSIALVAGDFVL